MNNTSLSISQPQTFSYKSEVFYLFHRFNRSWELPIFGTLKTYFGSNKLTVYVVIKRSNIHLVMSRNSFYPFYSVPVVHKHSQSLISFCLISLSQVTDVHSSSFPTHSCNSSLNSTSAIFSLSSFNIYPLLLQSPIHITLCQLWTYFHLSFLHSPFSYRHYYIHIHSCNQFLDFKWIN